MQGECNPVDNTGLLIVPFDFNQSQINAIDKALKSKISVIEGPPGTGKTQTILNLIANIFFVERTAQLFRTTIPQSINDKENKNLDFNAECAEYTEVGTQRGKNL